MAAEKQKRIAKTGYMLGTNEQLDPEEVERRTTCQCGKDSRPYEEEVDREFVVGREQPVVRVEVRCLTCGRTVK